MKRLIVSVLMLTMLATAGGCSSGRLFRRGARCDAPSFRFPSLRKFRDSRAQAPCAPGCNSSEGWTQPSVSYDGPPYAGAPYAGEVIESNGLTTSPIPVESETSTNRPLYPVYTDKAISPGEVIEGPELGTVPTGP